MAGAPALDVITLGRASVDLYGQQIGGRLEDMASFAKSVCRQHRQAFRVDPHAIDQTMAVEDGNCVTVPRGYHPVGASHGYDLYYLNVMAGPKRQWCFKNDPAHAWIVNSVKKG